MQKIVHSEQETIALAQDIARIVRCGDVIFLKGDLGVGKSVFARAFLREISKNQNLDVPSPTFTLVQTYETDIAPIWHFDLYRLETSEEIYELGWEDALYDGILLIEWPERLGELAPAEHLEIRLQHTNQNTQSRTINLTPHGQWDARLTELEQE